MRIRCSEWLKSEKLLLLQGWKRNGLTDEQVAGNIGISVRSLYNWKKNNPQIARALKIGKQEANFSVENKLFERALGGNTTAMIFWLKNNWRDKYNDSALSPEELAMTRARRENIEQDTKLKALKAKAMEKLGLDSDTKVDELLAKLVSEADKENDVKKPTDGETD